MWAGWRFAWLVRPRGIQPAPPHTRRPHPPAASAPQALEALIDALPRGAVQPVLPGLPRSELAVAEAAAAPASEQQEAQQEQPGQAQQRRAPQQTSEQTVRRKRTRHRKEQQQLLQQQPVAALAQAPQNAPSQEGAAANHIQPTSQGANPFAAAGCRVSGDSKSGTKRQPDGTANGTHLDGGSSKRQQLSPATSALGEAAATRGVSADAVSHTQTGLQPQEAQRAASAPAAPQWQQWQPMHRPMPSVPRVSDSCLCALRWHAQCAAMPCRGRCYGWGACAATGPARSRPPPCASAPLLVLQPPALCPSPAQDSSSELRELLKQLSQARQAQQKQPAAVATAGALPSLGLGPAPSLGQLLGAPGGQAPGGSCAAAAPEIWTSSLEALAQLFSAEGSGIPAMSLPLPLPSP